MLSSISHPSSSQPQASAGATSLTSYPAVNGQNSGALYPKVRQCAVLLQPESRVTAASTGDVADMDECFKGAFSGALYFKVRQRAVLLQPESRLGAASTVDVANMDECFKRGINHRWLAASGVTPSSHIGAATVRSLLDIQTPPLHTRWITDKPEGGLFSLPRGGTLQRKG